MSNGEDLLKKFETLKKNSDQLKSEKIVCVWEYLILVKSRRTISRYISNGLLNPTKEKSDWGTLEYKFERKKVEKIKIYLRSSSML